MMTDERLEQIRRHNDKSTTNSPRQATQHVTELLNEIDRLRSLRADKPGAGLVIGQKYRLGDLPVGAQYSRHPTTAGWELVAHKAIGRHLGDGSVCEGCADGEVTLVSLPPQSTPADAKPTQMTEGRVREIVGEAFDVFLHEAQYHPEFVRRVRTAIKGGG
jgi:hypothetical protein